MNKVKKLGKKTILIGGIVLAVLACAALVIGLAAARKSKQVSLADAGLAEKTDIELTAYHGFSAVAPENSLPAFAAAAENGFSAVQFDVRRTVDGVWVVMHDETVKRMTDGRGSVEKMTFKQLVQCRINKGNGRKEYKGRSLTVPTLSQALSACAGRMIPAIEIQQSGTDCLESLLNEIGYATRRECRILSADREQLLKIKELTDSGSVALKSTQVQLEWVTDKLNKKTLELARQTPDIGVSFNAEKSGDADEIKSFTDAGISLSAWAVDKPERMKELYDAGVRRFATSRITNQPTETTETETVTAKQTKPITTPKTTKTTAKAKGDA
ncbi:MAG TPA: hypothetical protein DDY98_06875 [Ruminococcaceae bacterium]|nr:hypothetical protein [Oscillospiraceae bacterium]